MEILKYSEIDLADTIERSEQDVNNVLGTVSEILDNVRVNKDHAIREYTEKFDGVTIENLKVSEDEIKQLEDNLQKMTDKFIKEIDALVEAKSKEIMTV